MIHVTMPAPKDGWVGRPHHPSSQSPNSSPASLQSQENGVRALADKFPASRPPSVGPLSASYRNVWNPADDNHFAQQKLSLVQSCKKSMELGAGQIPRAGLSCPMLPPGEKQGRTTTGGVPGSSPSLRQAARASRCPSVLVTRRTSVFQEESALLRTLRGAS